MALCNLMLLCGIQPVGVVFIEQTCSYSPKKKKRYLSCLVHTPTTKIYPSKDIFEITNIFFNL